MKTRTSMKICESYGHVVSIPNGTIQYLMCGIEPRYYNCGTYGWNCDIYTDWSRDLLITTGYRNTRGKRISYDFAKKYDDIAKDICESTNDWDERQEKLMNLREDFFDALLTY